MIKRFTRTSLLILLLCLLSFVTKAQLGFNFQPYDLGFGFGDNEVHGDANSMTSTPTVHFNFTYNTTPFVNFIFEAQIGRLAGGDSTKTTGRQFTNDITAFTFRGQLQMGEIIDYQRSAFFNAVKNLYVSAGVGYENTHITHITRYSPDGIMYTPGPLNDDEPLLLLRIGYEFKIYNAYEQPSVMIDIGYESNFILGDTLDGFVSGNNHDSYTQFTLGIKFALGHSSNSYRKKIPF